MCGIVMKNFKSGVDVSVLILVMWFSTVVAPIVKVPGGTSSFLHFTSAGADTAWIFFLKTEKDGIIGLFENQDPSSLIYKIVLGGNVNRNSYLRDSYSNLLDSHDGAVVDKEAYFPFWLAWSESYIYVGMGTKIGVNIMLSSTDNTNPLGKYLAVSSGDAASYWMIHSQCAK